MLLNVGMVQMYSKSANVNDLGLHGHKLFSIRVRVRVRVRVDFI